jgi:HPt (histidine-containing phosphotransfer) domain-containing protein
MIDTQVFSQLCNDVGEQLARQLLSVYVSESRKQIDDLNRTHDINEIAHIAHSLKSSSRSYGALVLAQTCELLEMTTKHTGITLSALKPLVEQATEQSAHAFKDANKIIASLST